MDNKQLYTKITFLGDVMCERPLQNCMQKNGKKVFYNVFADTKNLFGESDYVVGNLETVFAGEEAVYTNEMYSFNTPDEFAEALKCSGIDMVTTSTNHSLDRGIKGLVRTLDVLDKYNIEHTGTFKSSEEKHYFVKEINGIKVAFLNYTYGTNTHETKVILKEDELFYLNLIKPQTFNYQEYVGTIEISKLRYMISTLSGKFINTEKKMKIKKMLGKPYNFVRIDALNESELNEKYFSVIEKDIENAKNESDIVIACVHAGGQFNCETGGFSKYIAKWFSDHEVNAFICNHSHVVQKAEVVDNMFSAYSLGNFSISPSSTYILHENLPEYSLAMHLYVDKSDVCRTAFSILKIVENKDGSMRVVPVDELYDSLSDKEKNVLNKDVLTIYNRVTSKNETQISINREYVI